MIRSNHHIASVAALTVTASLLPWKSAPGRGSGIAPSQAKPQTLHLRTDGLPTPLVVPGDPLKRAVTAFELQGELPPAGDGRGSITFDETRLTFNDFGDATTVGTKRAARVPALFRRIQVEDPRARPPTRRLQRSEQRRVYEL